MLKLFIPAHGMTIPYHPSTSQRKNIVQTKCQIFKVYYSLIMDNVSHYNYCSTRLV